MEISLAVGCVPRPELPKPPAGHSGMPPVKGAHRCLPFSNPGKSLPQASGQLPPAAPPCPLLRPPTLSHKEISHLAGLLRSAVLKTHRGEKPAQQLQIVPFVCWPVCYSPASGIHSHALHCRHSAGESCCRFLHPTAKPIQLPALIYLPHHSLMPLFLRGSICLIGSPPIPLTCNPTAGSRRHTPHLARFRARECDGSHRLPFSTSPPGLFPTH